MTGWGKLLAGKRAASCCRRGPSRPPRSARTALLAVALLFTAPPAIPAQEGEAYREQRITYCGDFVEMSAETRARYVGGLVEGMQAALFLVADTAFLNARTGVPRPGAAVGALRGFAARFVQGVQTYTLGELADAVAERCAPEEHRDQWVIQQLAPLIREIVVEAGEGGQGGGEERTGPPRR